MKPEITIEYLYQLLLDTLPDSDIADVPRETLYSYAVHGAFLWNSSPFCQVLDIERFLHFVFYPRINNEDLVDCRSFFYHQLEPRIRGLTDTQAVLEINRWCAEHVTYQSSDDRTKNPLTTYRSGTGRCGEESVFAVSALRSVGIPARQIYVPYWSHCDDNHAWVEVWTEGQWHFLGACEPEPILDQGWFLDASSRAPMAYYRTFWDYNENDELIDQQGIMRLYSVLPRYAQTAELNVSVPNGINAEIRVNVVNMASICPVAKGFASHGKYSVFLGRGNYLVEAVFNHKYAAAIADLSGGDCHILLDPADLNTELQIMNADFTAPTANPRNTSFLPNVLSESKKSVIESCTKIRAANKRKCSCLFDLPSSYAEHSGQNSSEIAAFLEMSQSSSSAYALLDHLCSKDFSDITAALLYHHWQASMAFEDRPHFVDSVMNPRIHTEKISPWRNVGTLLPALSPEALYNWLETNYPLSIHNTCPSCIISPNGILQSGFTDQLSRDILFVAALRSRGIPARLAKSDDVPEYLENGVFHRLRNPHCCKLFLNGINPANMHSGIHYSLAHWNGSFYKPMRTEDSTVLCLPKGFYRLVTSNRLPCGDQLCQITSFCLEPGQTLSIPVELRQADIHRMLSHYALPHFTLTNIAGNSICSESLLCGKTLLIYVSNHHEPTIHILNELLALPDRSLNICMIAQSPDDIKDSLIQQVLQLFPNSSAFADQSSSERMARKMFLEPDVFPLLILADQRHIGYYGCCGYNVGSIPLVSSLYHLLP